MTVFELIKELQKLPQHLDVVTASADPVVVDYSVGGLCVFIIDEDGA